MTIEDVITKSGVTMGVLFVVAAATFLLMPLSLVTPTLIVTAIVGFRTVLLVSMRRVVSPAAVPACPVVEGLFIGGLSKMFEYLYPGIVSQAVLGTFVAAGVTLAAYKTLRIRVTDKFRRIVFIATLGIAAMYLINLVVSLFGVSTGLVAIGPSAGVLSWIVSAVAIVLAVANLIMDFDYIERGDRQRRPEVRVVARPRPDRHDGLAVHRDPADPVVLPQLTLRTDLAHARAPSHLGEGPSRRPASCGPARRGGRSAGCASLRSCWGAWRCSSERAPVAHGRSRQRSNRPTRTPRWCRPRRARPGRTARGNAPRR